MNTATWDNHRMRKLYRELAEAAGLAYAQGPEAQLAFRAVLTVLDSMIAQQTADYAKRGRYYTRERKLSRQGAHK